MRDGKDKLGFWYTIGVAGLYMAAAMLAVPAAIARASAPLWVDFLED